MKNVGRNTQGSALITYVVLCLLVVAGMLWFSNWSSMKSRLSVRQTSSERALQFANSGINYAEEQLKKPNSFMAIGSSMTLSSPVTNNGRFKVSLYRTSLNIFVIQGYSTGYYYLNNGPTVDPDTGQSAQMAVIEVKYNLTSVGEFLFSVPNSVEISTSANFGPTGAVFGSNLIFDPGGTIQMAAALYTSTVFPANPPNLISTSGAPLTPQRLLTAPNFGSLDSNVRASYFGKAAAGGCPSFINTTVAAGNTPVYYCPNDVTIKNLTVSGVYVIYSTGDVHIQGNIQPDNIATSWVGILAEGDIHIDNGTPSPLTVEGNFVAGGSFMADGVPNNGDFSFVGGITAMYNISISPVWTGNRSYTYFASNSPNLLLPNSASIMEYTILQGKYSGG